MSPGLSAGLPSFLWPSVCPTACPLHLHLLLSSFSFLALLLPFLIFFPSLVSVFVLPLLALPSLCVCSLTSASFLCCSQSLSVSDFCSLYFYPSDTPPVTTSQSLPLPRLRSQLLVPISWWRPGSRRAPTPGSSLPPAVPNEPGGGMTLRPRPGLRHCPARGLGRRYKGAARIAAQAHCAVGGPGDGLAVGG